MNEAKVEADFSQAEDKTNVSKLYLVQSKCGTGLPLTSAIAI